MISIIREKMWCIFMILYTTLSNMFPVQGNFHLTIYWNMCKYWWILNRPIVVIISQYVYTWNHVMNQQNVESVKCQLHLKKKERPETVKIFCMSNLEKFSNTLDSDSIIPRRIYPPLPHTSSVDVHDAFIIILGPWPSSSYNSVNFPMRCINSRSYLFSKELTQ